MACILWGVGQVVSRVLTTTRCTSGQLRFSVKHARGLLSLSCLMVDKTPPREPCGVNARALHISTRRVGDILGRLTIISTEYIMHTGITKGKVSTAVTLSWHISRVQLVPHDEVVDGRPRGYRRKLTEGNRYAVYRGQPRERSRRHGEGTAGIVRFSDDQAGMSRRRWKWAGGGGVERCVAGALTLLCWALLASDDPVMYRPHRT